MSLSLSEAQAVNEMAKALWAFLPGKPHPYADQAISFQGVAAELGLAGLWSGGSKQPAIATLLSQTLEKRRDKFCPLMVAIVKKGMIYRSNKNEPVTLEEIEHLNSLIVKVGFKIPDLWDADFRHSLPSVGKTKLQQGASTASEQYKELYKELMRIGELESQERGYAFEGFLKQLFTAAGMDPKSAFRLTGEQIDGSFQLDGFTYLVEAKWHAQLTPQSDLIVFQGKVEVKAEWSRGLFVSYTGFSPDGLEAFSRGRTTRLVGMTGQDLLFILEGRMTLENAIRAKARRAVETGRFFVPVFELSVS